MREGKGPPLTAGVNFQRRPKGVPATGWVGVFDATPPGLPAWTIGTGHGRGTLAVDQGAAWVANRTSRTVSRLDLPQMELSAISRVRGVPVAIASGAGAVWVLCGNGWL